MGWPSGYQPAEKIEKQDTLGGGFKDFLFSSLFGEMIQFD